METDELIASNFHIVKGFLMMAKRFLILMFMIIILMLCRNLLISLSFSWYNSIFSEYKEYLIHHGDFVYQNQILTPYCGGLVSLDIKPYKSSSLHLGINTLGFEFLVLIFRTFNIFESTKTIIIILLYENLMVLVPDISRKPNLVSTSKQDGSLPSVLQQDVKTIDRILQEFILFCLLLRPVLQDSVYHLPDSVILNSDSVKLKSVTHCIISVSSSAIIRDLENLSSLLILNWPRNWRKE